jgi:hypothetical protein
MPPLSQYFPYPAPIVLALDNATVDWEQDIGGLGLALANATGTVQVRLNELDNPLLTLNQLGALNAPFQRLFFTWAAQPGKVATIYITNGNLSLVSNPSAILVDASGLLGNPMQASATPTVYNVACTNANQEYSQALPTGCKRFEMHVLDDSSAYRVAYVAGKVAGPTAPYLNKMQAAYYWEEQLTLSGKTLYFATSNAGVVMEILAWV